MSNELKPADIRRHPIAQLLSDAASGALPTDSDLDALKPPDTARTQVADAASLAAAASASGDKQEARNIAGEAADRIIRGLPPELQDPDYLKAPEVDVSDPEGLADMVSRGW
jgi:hypothetical protein